MSNIKKYNQFEQIEQYYTNDAVLSDKDREIAERWELAFALIQKHKSKKVAVSRLIAVEEAKGNKLSQAQAYRDIANSEKLFVPLRKYSKDLLRHVLIESAMNDLEKLKKRMKDSDGEKLSSNQWLKFLEMKHKIEYRLIELSGIGDENPDMPDFTKLEVHKYEISIDDEFKNMFKKMLQSGVIDVTELLREAQDIDHEDLTDEDT